LALLQALLIRVTSFALTSRLYNGLNLLVFSKAIFETGAVRSVEVPARITK